LEKKGRREGCYRQTVVKPRRLLSLIFSINIPRVQTTGYFYVKGDGMGMDKRKRREGTGRNNSSSTKEIDRERVEDGER
jgi:hypothetical protein